MRSEGPRGTERRDDDVERKIYFLPLGGVFSAVEAGGREEEQTDEKVVEGEHLCHHGPLPAQPGHGEEPSGQHRSGAGARQPASERRRPVHRVYSKIHTMYLIPSKPSNQTNI